jgi:uncharacterized protein YndB with AHSA1/START domain
MAECRSRGNTEAPPELVWELVADHVGMSRWAPLRAVALEREGESVPGGVGAIRVVKSRSGTLREEITAFEPPRRLAYRLLSGAPVRNYEAVVELSPSRDGTEIVWSASFRPRLPGVRIVVARTLAGLVKGLVAESERRARAA